MTKARACKGACQKWSLGVTFHAPGSVGKCDRMIPTLPNELPLWKLESRWTSGFSKGDCKGQNSLEWKVHYITKKFNGKELSEMGSHDPFGYLKHKLWPIERSRVKLLIKLSTIKNQELPWFACV
jgi:hypothetical protein